MQLLDRKIDTAKSQSLQDRRTIRVSFASAIATRNFGRFISRYSIENPDITLDLNVLDKREDIDDSLNHLAIRVGWPESQPTGQAIYVRPAASHLVCSGEYLQASDLSDFSRLEKCRWVYMRGLPLPIRLGYNDGYVEITPTNIVYVNSSYIAYDLVYNSVGISTLLDFVIEDDKAWDRVEILFPEYKLPARHLFIAVRSDMRNDETILDFAEAVRRHFAD